MARWATTYPVCEASSPLLSILPLQQLLGIVPLLHPLLELQSLMQCNRHTKKKKIDHVIPSYHILLLHKFDFPSSSPSLFPCPTVPPFFPLPPSLSIFGLVTYKTALFPAPLWPIKEQSATFVFQAEQELSFSIISARSCDISFFILVKELEAPFNTAKQSNTRRNKTTQNKTKQHKPTQNNTIEG